MKTSNNSGVFATAWEAELVQAELELRQIERERALDDVVRMIKRFEITVNEIRDFMGPNWATSKIENIKPFEPYFDRR